jgi:hypothetical protein
MELQRPAGRARSPEEQKTSGSFSNHHQERKAALYPNSAPPAKGRKYNIPFSNFLHLAPD